jgi:hypothetical protein
MDAVEQYAPSCSFMRRKRELGSMNVVNRFLSDVEIDLDHFQESLHSLLHTLLSTISFPSRAAAAANAAGFTEDNTNDDIQFELFNNMMDFVECDKLRPLSYPAAPLFYHNQIDAEGM